MPAYSQSSSQSWSPSREEVRVEQIVVARNRRLGRLAERGCDLLHEVLDDPVRVGYRHGPGARRGEVTAGHPERVELAGERPEVMEGPQHAGDAGEHLRIRHLTLRERVTVDEAGHEKALGLDERRDLGREAESGGAGVGLALDPPVDLEQVGVGPRDAQDEALVVDLDQEVAVGDPALERAEHAGAAGPAGNALNDLGRIRLAHRAGSLRFPHFVPAPTCAPPATLTRG